MFMRKRYAWFTRSELLRNRGTIVFKNGQTILVSNISSLNPIIGYNAIKCEKKRINIILCAPNVKDGVKRVFCFSQLSVSYAIER